MDLQPSLQITFGQDSNLHLLLALLIMLLAGALGGLVNHYLAERQSLDDAHRYDKPTLRRYLILGMVTALTAPLLLSVLSSNLLENLRLQASQFYVFAAFCLVHVVVVQRLFEHPTAAAAYRQRLEQLRREVEQLRQEQEALHQYLEPMLSAFEAQQQESKNELREALTYNDVEILRALADESYIYGNLAALSEKTALGRELISQRLAVLKTMGMIETRITDKNVLHWVISARGRQALTGILNGQNGEAETVPDPHKKSA